MEQSKSPPNPYSARYWRCLYEFKVRNLKFAERRLLEKINDLTYGRGQADVAIANRDDLAESVESTRNNLQPLIESLISRDILGHEERLGTWWLKNIDLWQVASGDQADPLRVQRAVAAEARIIAHDTLRQQPELIPRETTDAEVAAEGQQAHAADWPVTGFPSAVISPPSAVPPPAAGSENQNEDDPGQGRLNFRTAVLKFRRSVLNFRTSEPAPSARGASEPGHPVNTILNIPGRPGAEDRPPPPLDYAGWSLVKDLEAFCVAGGDAPFSEDHRRQWTWRARKNPLRLELCVAETKAHVREERRPAIRTRAGWIKRLWREEEAKDVLPASAEEAAFARRAREEADKILGAPKP